MTRIAKDGRVDPRYETKPLAPRLFAKVKRAENGCLEWQGATRRGYGLMMYERKKIATHRAAWIVYHGDLPDPTMIVRHTCDNKLCVAKEHLLLGTLQDNSDDMVSRDRSMRGERNAQAKLTLDQVASIKRRVEAGEVQKHLAEEFNVTPTTIYFIVHGKKWSTALEKDLASCLTPTA